MNKKQSIIKPIVFVVGVCFILVLLQPDHQTKSTFTASASYVEKPVTKTEPQPEVVNQSNFHDKALSAGLNENQIKTLIQVGKEYNIDPKYLATIGLTENLKNPWEVGDNGCSYGAYQINICVHKSTPLYPSILDCAKDFSCSSKWTAWQIKNSYCKALNIQDQWKNCLYYHNGYVGVPQWYKDKINNNGHLLGLDN